MRLTRPRKVRPRRAAATPGWVAGTVTPGAAAAVTGERLGCCIANAKAVFLTPDPEPPRELVGVQFASPETLFGQNDGLRQVVIVRVARACLDIAHAFGPAAADFLPRPALAQYAEQVTGREADHEAAAAVLEFHWRILS